MQVRAVNLVVLALLVLFMGVHQYARPLARNRLWFAGGVCVLLNMVFAEVNQAQPIMNWWRGAAQFDFILLAQLLFVMSLVASDPRLWRVVRFGSIIGVPAVIGLNAYLMKRTPVAVVVLAMVLWQVFGVYAIRIFMPKQWRVRRLLLLCVCVVYGSVFATYLLWARNPDVQHWVLAELVLFSAILYGAGEQRRSVASIVGTAGFLLWACFYLLHARVSVALPADRLHWVALFWDIPKFLVALSMLLQIAEDARHEKEQLAERYRELYEDFHLLYEEHPHPSWIYDPQTGCLITANRAAEAVYGYTESELAGMAMARLETINDADCEAADAILPPLAVGRRSRHRRSDGTLMWVNVSERDVIFQGRPARVVLARDITEQLVSSLALLHRAHHDALTGLPNRHQLDDRIDACLARSDRENRMAALLTIDVDHFKQINDTYGHRVGDECLKAVAERLQSRIRQADTLARSGGEEFTAIIGALHSAADAAKVAAMLLDLFAKPIELPDLEIFLTISIGVALFPDDSSDRETLKQQSDDALYEAKRCGRNLVVFAAPRRERPILSAGAAELPVV